MLKDPNWWEVDQLAICSQRVIQDLTWGLLRIKSL